MMISVAIHEQVDGYENIFAIGDCTDWDEPKLGYAAQNQATIVAKNITNLVAVSAAFRVRCSLPHVVVAVPPGQAA